MKQAFKAHADALSRLAVALIFAILILISPSFGTITNILNVLRISSLTLMIATGIAMYARRQHRPVDRRDNRADVGLFGRYFQTATRRSRWSWHGGHTRAQRRDRRVERALCVAYLKLPPFLATYGVQIARGLAYLLTGLGVSNLPRNLFIGGGYALGVPAPILFGGSAYRDRLMLNKRRSGGASTRSARTARPRATRAQRKGHAAHRLHAFG